ncbi:MAG: response regulator [Candidatus Riflebacteria bacterium]|nr:response regulator [Candidatus Riflebacteria bacterium]
MSSILIIDDSKFLCAVLRDTLEKTGYRATTVNSIVEAAKFLKVETPDLILLDINLPGGVQGNDACRMLKTSPSCKNVPIVLMSGASPEEMQAKQLQAGADGFLVKPFTPEQIVRWLGENKALLERRRSVS